jgi:hypothetical protein
MNANTKSEFGRIEIEVENGDKCDEINVLYTPLKIYGYGYRYNNNRLYPKSE